MHSKVPGSSFPGHPDLFSVRTVRAEDQQRLQLVLTVLGNCLVPIEGRRFSLKALYSEAAELGYNYLRAAVVTTWVPMHRGKFFWMVVLLGASQPHLFAASSPRGE